MRFEGLERVGRHYDGVRHAHSSFQDTDHPAQKGVAVHRAELSRYPEEQSQGGEDGKIEPLETAYGQVGILQGV